MFLKLFTHTIGYDQIVSPLLWTILLESNDIIVFPIELVLMENDFLNHFQRKHWIDEAFFSSDNEKFGF
jgi:hypothetical protein